MSISSKIALAMSADGASFEEVHNSLEQIADNYAVEFAEWVGINYFVYNTWEESKSIEELLEQFKKEKGL